MSNISINHQFIVEGEIQSAFGFYKFYFYNLHLYGNRETCFYYCNLYFKQQFGCDRYTSYSDFKEGMNLRYISNKPQKKIQLQPDLNKDALQILEREYLLSWFKSKGFNTWTSFKALVMHYYPLTVESFLYEFWQSKSFDAETQKNVGYVKQIIGE